MIKIKRGFAFSLLLISRLSACLYDPESDIDECEIEGCPMTKCEDKTWQTRYYAKMACEACDAVGYSDIGIVETVIQDARFDEEFYGAKKEFVDSIYDFAHLPVETSGYALVVKIISNYCTENIDTSFRLIQTVDMEAFRLDVLREAEPLYMVEKRDSTNEFPYWYENKRVCESTGW